jgi:hypothetical protein
MPKKTEPMKNIIRFLLGLNGASIVRGLRFGIPEFISTCFASLGAVHPLEDRAARNHHKELGSIPKVTLDEILGNRKVPITLDIQKRVDGMLSSQDAIALLSILVAENPGEVLEIGTYMGYSAKIMAGNLPAGIIHTVDLPLDFSEQTADGVTIPKDDFHLIRARVVGREFKGHAVEVRIKQHFGDTARMDFREFGQPNFFFIDGSHTYEYCKQDSEKCYEACKGQGTFLWHDCDELHPGVVKFIGEWRAAGRNICRIEGTYMAYWKSPQPGHT